MLSQGDVGQASSWSGRSVKSGRDVGQGDVGQDSVGQDGVGQAEVLSQGDVGQASALVRPKC